eukprot:TRINITY_DN68631_c0_g1_i1.p1 TRINITY_DN68631_c0_g1~~TRINITY_DN68631_c0_g1_i1.p1  ORF type:complete len:351 (+),score=21.48 TRINITY_DN68631_c0_g1_i1:99-1151(+)
MPLSCLVSPERGANCANGAGEACAGVWAKCGGVFSQNMTRFLNTTSPLLLDYVAHGHCPYGQEFVGVTIPGPPVRLEKFISPPTPFRHLAVFWCALPSLVVVFVLISFLFRRGIRQFHVLLFLAIVWVICSSIQALVHDPRPGTFFQVTDVDGKFVGSCAQGCGMPCVYSAWSAGLLVLFLSDAVFRVHSDSCTLGDNQRRPRSQRPVGGSHSRSPTITEMHVQESPESQSLASIDSRTVKTILGILSFTPWVPYETVTHKEFIAFASFWFLTMGPIPLMRIALYDSTAEQAIVGIVVGICCGSLWTIMVRRLGRQLQSVQNGRLWGGFVNDLRFPDTRPSSSSALGETH